MPTDKVAMKLIIDNIASQAVETQLVGKLGDLLSSARVIQMEPNLVSRIAAESPDNRLQRERLTRKLVILQAGLESCKKYVGRSTMSQSKAIRLARQANFNPDLQHRLWHTDVYLSSEDESGDEILHSSSELEEVDAQDAVGALAIY
jgi:hypothetical protein